MKKHFIGLVLVASWPVYAQTPISFIVKGKIGQLNAPAKIYLVRGIEAMDSAVLKNGAFEFKGTIDVPKSANLVIKRDGKFGTGMFGVIDAIQVFLESGSVVLTSLDSLRKASVTGGPVTADDQRLQNSLQAVFAKMKAQEARNNNIPEEKRKSTEYTEQIKTQFEVINKELAHTYRVFIKANPASWVSLDALINMGMIEVPQYEVVSPLYEAFSPALKNSPQGQQYDKMLQKLKKLVIGAPAPGFNQKTSKGTTVSLANYRGKYVLVDFWASWCGPCRADNPAITKVYNEYRGRNFDILGVSLDNENDHAKWLKAIQDDHLVWTQVSDLRGWKNEAAQLYNVNSIPQNFLIDPYGKIVAFNIRGEELRAVIAHFIK